VATRLFFEYDLTVNQVFDFAGAQAEDLHKVPKNMRDFVFSELLFPVLIDKEFRSASLRDAYVSAKKKTVLYDFAAMEKDNYEIEPLFVRKELLGLLGDGDVVVF